MSIVIWTLFQHKRFQQRVIEPWWPFSKSISFGNNVSIPSMFTDSAPVLEPTTSNDIVRRNSNVMHSGGQKLPKDRIYSKNKIGLNIQFQDLK